MTTQSNNMSIDNDAPSPDIWDGVSRRKSDAIVLDMYYTLQALKSKMDQINVSLAEEKLKQIHNEKTLEEFKLQLNSISEKLNELKINEARQSIKFGVITFIGTFLFVTLTNVWIDSAFSEELPTDLVAIPPYKLEIEGRYNHGENDNDESE